MTDNDLHSEEERLEWVHAWVDSIASALEAEWAMIH